MFQIVITKRELLELWNALPTLADLKGFNLGYAVARTKVKLRPEIEALDESLKPDDAFQEYTKRRLELCNYYAQKDERGPIILGNKFVFGDNQKAFDEAMIPLNVEFAQATKYREQQSLDYNNALSEPITVEIHQITKSDIPLDPEPTVAQMGVLYYLLREQDVVVPLKAV
jgi:hypothetical protein